MIIITVFFYFYLQRKKIHQVHILVGGGYTNQIEKQQVLLNNIKNYKFHYWKYNIIMYMLDVSSWFHFKVSTDNAEKEGHLYMVYMSLLALFYVHIIHLMYFYVFINPKIQQIDVQLRTLSSNHEPHDRGS